MRRCDLYHGTRHEEEILQSFVSDILDKWMVIDLSMSQGSQETGDGKTSGGHRIKVVASDKAGDACMRVCGLYRR